MPKLVVTSSVTVIRNGKRVSPAIGKVFNFTDDEAKYILKHHPLGLRKPVVEVLDEDTSHQEPEAPAAEDDGDDDTDETETKAPAKKPAKGKKAKQAADEDDDI